jgi:hypothetical protein
MPVTTQEPDQEQQGERPDQREPYWPGCLILLASLWFVFSLGRAVIVKKTIL